MRENPLMALKRTQELIRTEKGDDKTVKELLGKYLIRAVIFGLIMTVIGFFRGGIRYPLEETETFLPIWLQLLRLFAIYAAAFLAVNVLADLITHGKKKR
jgi:hypothetical protein